MEIKHWLVTGDTHGRIVNRILQIDKEKYPPEETALIILGDAGANFYLNKTDSKNKKDINNRHYYIYCVRGNHEARPVDIPGMELIYDNQVQGYVYMESNFPYIRYFVDGMNYVIDGKKVLVIGGAYSVDKYYRLARFDEDAKWTGWFENEQLSPIERDLIEKFVEGESYDIVLTHTCPRSWQPTELFIDGLPQEFVDNSMEDWLDELKDKFSWSTWFYGHYHADIFYHSRHAIMLYEQIIPFGEIK